MKELEHAAEVLFSSRGEDSAQCTDILYGIRKMMHKLRLELSDSSKDDDDARDDTPMWLKAILRTTRAIEPTFLFQQQLYNDKQRVSKAMNCSAAQFTYGTTSYGFFRKVLECPPIACAMLPSPSSPYPKPPLPSHRPPFAPKCAVFGSSAGLLSFYISAVYPHARVDGYEVLPCLVNLGDRLRERYCTSGSNIAFHLKDMLEVDVSQCAVVVLTSLCWDSATRRAVSSKLSKECPAGCIVMDYQDIMRESGLEARGGRYAQQTTRFGTGVGTGLFITPQQSRLEGALYRAEESGIIKSLEKVLEKYQVDVFGSPDGAGLAKANGKWPVKFSLVANPAGDVSWSNRAHGGGQRIFVYQASLEVP